MNHPEVKNIYLYGQLREMCGGHEMVRIAANDMATVVSGLTSRFGSKIKPFITQNKWQICFDDPDSDSVGEDVVHQIKDVSDIHMFPAIEGSGKVGKIILGVVLIVVGAVYGYYTGDWASAIQIMGMGVGLIINAMLTPKAQSERAAPEERASFIFNGAVNVIEQGGAVPVVCGRIRTGSTLVSAGISTEQIAIGAGSSGYGSDNAPDSEFDIDPLVV